MKKKKNKVFCSDRNILFILGAKAVAFYGRIFIKKSVWEKMSPLYRSALLIHETTHLLQQEKYGFIWYLKYALLKKFRLEQEIEGFGNEIVFIIKGCPDMKKQLLNRYAEHLSGRTYLYMTDFARAISRLEEYIANENNFK